MIKKRKRLKIRQANFNDVARIVHIEKQAWGKDKAATKEMFKSRIKHFSQGTLVAELNDELIGVVATCRVNYKFIENNHSWYRITDSGYIKNSHNPEGDTIFGIDLSVDPKYQNMQVGTKLLEAIGRLAIKYNLKRGVLGGRIPDYHKYCHKLTVDEYIKATVKTSSGVKALDPEIDFYSKAGLSIACIIPNYFKDPESLNYGVLLVWNNPFYNKWYSWLGQKLFRV